MSQNVDALVYSAGLSFPVDWFLSICIQRREDSYANLYVTGLGLGSSEEGDAPGARWFPSTACGLKTSYAARVHSSTMQLVPLLPFDVFKMRFWMSFAS